MPMAPARRCQLAPPEAGFETWMAEALPWALDSTALTASFVPGAAVPRQVGLGRGKIRLREKLESLARDRIYLTL